MTINECLKNVVGISDTVCACFDDDNVPPGHEYRLSESGYWMDDDVYGLPLTFPASIADCDGPTLWDIANKSRDTGITHFLTDYSASLRTSEFITSPPNFSGYMGTRTGSYRALTEQFTGTKFIPYRYKGTKMTLTDAWVMTNVADSTPISMKVYGSDDMVTEIATLTGTVFNKVAIVSDVAPVEILLVDSNGNKRDIYFILDSWTDPILLNSTKCAGCQRSKKTKASVWGAYGGVKDDSLAALLTTDLQEIAYGISPNITFTCGLDFLCDLDYSGTETYPRMIAESIMLYSNRALASAILISDKVNTYSAARAGDLQVKLEDINVSITERMGFFSEGISKDITDCFFCKPQYKKRSLLV